MEPVSVSREARACCCTRVRSNFTNTHTEEPLHTHRPTIHWGCMFFDKLFTFREKYMMAGIGGLGLLPQLLFSFRESDPAKHQKSWGVSRGCVHEWQKHINISSHCFLHVCKVAGASGLCSCFSFHTHSWFGSAFCIQYPPQSDRAPCRRKVAIKKY